MFLEVVIRFRLLHSSLSMALVGHNQADDELIYCAL
jgi:hypothetical protein